MSQFNPNNTATATTAGTSASCPSCHKVSTRPLFNLASSKTRIGKYSEFAKNTNDFFSRDFPSGIVRVEARTQSRNLLATRPGKCDAFSDEFKVTATRELSTGAIGTEVKNTSNFFFPKTKVETKSVTTLTSNNFLTQQLTINNAVLDGLKLELTGTLQPNGSNTAKANIEMSNRCFLTTTSVDVLRGPIMTTDMSSRFRDFQFGGEVGYDVARKSIDKYSLAISLDRLREKATLQAHTGFKSFTASYYQRFTDQLEVAYRASWNAKVPNLAMEVGAKWNMIGGGFAKAKLDNVGRLGVALASDVRPGMQVTLGATVDMTKLGENAHKLGMELVYSA